MCPVRTKWAFTPCSRTSFWLTENFSNIRDHLNNPKELTDANICAKISILHSYISDLNISQINHQDHEAIKPTATPFPAQKRPEKEKSHELRHNP